MILNRYNQKIMADAAASTRIAIDTETVSLTDKTLIGFSFAYEKNKKIYSYYIPVRHTKFRNMPLEDVQQILKQLLNWDQLVFHNYVFDGMVFAKFGIPVKAAIVHDTMLLAHLLDENGRQGLKPCALRYCHHQMKHFKEIVGTGKSRISFADVDKEIAVKYGSEDAEYTYKLFEILYPMVIADDNLYKIYETIERPLLLVVEDMQIKGITIDIDQVNRIREDCQLRVSNALEQIEYLMPNINLNSPKQLREYFINKKRLKPLKLSKKTQLGSVDAKFLEHYKEKCPEIKQLLAYRKYNKILSTFIPALTPKEGNKIYAQFRQSGTTSGRFSSSNPNLQNIPRVTDEFDIRSCFIAGKGNVLIGLDYSQIELRVAAHLSQEPNMLNIYLNNGDIHQLTADACICSRQKAKTINFAMLYGIYFKALAELLKVSEQEAIKYVSLYWKKYPQLAKFITQTKKDAMKQGYLETICGRKRHMSAEFGDKEEFKKGAELRSMTNAVIQGSAADILKLAMIEIYQPLKDLGGSIIMTIHDELVCEVPEKIAEKAYKLIKEKMLLAAKILSVPMKVEGGIGKTWSEIH